jgi:hypothetical protein
MQFDNLYEYIDQTYDVQLDKAFLKKEAPSLTYLKLVRVLSVLKIDPTGQSAEALFADAVRQERSAFTPHQYSLVQNLLTLADLHEIIETLIRKSGKKTNAPFDNGQFADDINS